MKLFRIYYMACSYTSEWYVKAANQAEAEKKFRSAKGSHTILNIEEVSR